MNPHSPPHPTPLASSGHLNESTVHHIPHHLSPVDTSMNPHSPPHPTSLVSSGHLNEPTQSTTSHTPNFTQPTACPDLLRNLITFLCLLVHFFPLPAPSPRTFQSPRNCNPPLPGWLPIGPYSFTAHSITALFRGPMKTCNKPWLG